MVDIFNNVTINYDALIKYGFVYMDKFYYYIKELKEVNMTMHIKITDESNIKSYLIDNDTGLLYENYRLDTSNGFSSKVRKLYLDTLNDLKSKCMQVSIYKDPQANRINNLIYEKYKVKPEFLFNDYPDAGIYRNKRNKKWFSLIMNINLNKLNSNNKEEHDIINIKVDDPIKYIDNITIYKAYHMNKKYWITIVLNDTKEDDDIMQLISLSYHIIDKK